MTVDSKWGILTPQLKGSWSFLAPGALPGPFKLVPVSKCFTGGTVNHFYRFLPVYCSTNCPPYP